jgi:hypothetical protein
MNIDALIQQLDSIKHHVIELSEREAAAVSGFQVATDLSKAAEAKVAALRPLLADLVEAADQAEADAKKLRFSAHGRALAAKAKRWRATAAAAEVQL